VRFQQSFLVKYKEHEKAFYVPKEKEVLL